jgi:7-cyano-7-deazaguanine synthase
MALARNASVQLGLGVHSGDHQIYPDCRAEFYEAMHNAFAIGNWDADRVSLYLPYLEIDKAGILRDAFASIEQLELDFDTVFRNTCTSYSPDDSGRSHGMTGADVERILAFHRLGRRDPIEYLEPWNKVVAQALEMDQRFLNPNAR